MKLCFNRLEAEVRRLMKEKEQQDLKIKSLTESVKTKDGEVFHLYFQARNCVFNNLSYSTCTFLAGIYFKVTAEASSC